MKYSTDWFTKNIPIWEQALADFKGKPIHALELGSFEGRSAVWLLENILTHKDAKLVCVDSWRDNIFFTQPGQEVDWDAVIKRFDSNVTQRFTDKVEVNDLRTTDFLTGRVPGQEFDLIYVDADHTSSACLTDGVLSHLLLKPGGIIIFDDYLWGGLAHAPNVCKGAIDAFMECYAEEYELLSCGYQVILRKK